MITLKAILFDAGDVLYHRPRRHAVLVEFLAKYGLPVPPPEGSRTVDLKRQAFVRQISRNKYIDAMLHLYGLRSPAALAEGRKIFDTVLADVEFFDGVPETLHRLKAEGLRLGVVTNAYDSTKTKLGWFSKVGIDGIWDSFANSCELKVSKPDARIYLVALEAIGVHPQEAAFVGHAAVELEGAKALGMTTVAFNRDDETITADHVISTFPELLNLTGVVE